MLKQITALIASGAIALGIYTPPTVADANFGPSNPFYAPSTLPFHAPPFDKIKDEDYQPAIEAGRRLFRWLLRLSVVGDAR
jgi:peptidyl-dipeptidase Dcp